MVWQGETSEADGGGLQADGTGGEGAVATDHRQAPSEEGFAGIGLETLHRGLTAIVDT